MKVLSLFSAFVLFLHMAATPVLAVPEEQDGKVLKMAISDPDTSEMGVMAEAFKKYVEEKSAGELKVEIYYAGTLGEETETIHNVRRGALAMSCVGISNLAPFAKKLSILTLPYLFDNLDEVLAGTKGKAHEVLNRHAVEGGVRVLSWVYSGFRHLSNSKHPVTKLADMKDLKVRVPQSTVTLSTYKAWKAIPILLPWSDVFTALSDGIVDGQCYGYTGFRSMNFIKANQKYLTELHYTYLLQPMIISERIFRQLPPVLKQVVVEAGYHAQEEALAYQRTAMSEAKTALEGKGLKITVLEDEAEWKKAAISTVWPEMEAFVGGRDIINEYLRSFGKEQWQ